LVNFNEMSKREYDELGFLYEQRYGPYKSFKNSLIVDCNINPYIRQLMDIVFEIGVEKLRIDIVEKFLFFKISREDSRKILSILLRNNVISEQGKLLMSNEEYSKFIQELLDESKSKIKAVKKKEIMKEEIQTDRIQTDQILKDQIQKNEDTVYETVDNEVRFLSPRQLFIYSALIVVSSILCAITYRVFGFAFLIPAFVIIGASLYKHTR
jgi:hypothetical protein